MKYRLQHRRLHEQWADTDIIVNGTAAANKYLTDRFDHPDILDWRVGYLLMTKEGAEGNPATMYQFEPVKEK